MKHKKSKRFFSAQKSKGFLTCLNCNSLKVRKKKIDFKVYGVNLGNFEAEVCSKCGEKIFDEATFDEIERVAKKRGLWGLEARTKIGIAGDGLIIRVNKKIADFMGLKKGEEITLIPENKNKLNVTI